MAFEEMDAPAPSRSVGGAKAPTASIPDSSVKASAAQVEKREVSGSGLTEGERHHTQLPCSFFLD